MQDESPKVCFVIMPFTVKEIDQHRYADSNHWNEVYEGLILPAIQEAGLQSERDDRDIGSRLIVEGILEKLEVADVILCDLSSHNANVFLELGWVLRADKPFILIKDNLTDYTFDLNQQYTFTYSHSLQPTMLRSQIGQLANVIRRTLEDTERRYSLVKRMSISISAIKAVKGGDFQAQILSDIQHRLMTLQNNARGRSSELDVFPWPELLRRATSTLFTVKEELQQMGDVHDQIELVPKLSSILRRLGAYHSREIQVALIDQDKRWIFHDWQEFIGQSAEHIGFERVLSEIFKYPHGAVAWSDRGSNVARTAMAPTYKRMNIGVFSTLENSDWKIFVETHQEIES